MKDRVLSVLVGVGFVLSAFILLPQGVWGASLLPEEITGIFDLMGPDGTQTSVFLTSRVRVGLVIALAVLVLVAVVYAMIAAFKYIQSQGDAGKIEEAQKAIKAIFMGIAAMLIGVVGIVLVFVFFGATKPNASLFQTCLSAPNSVGCDACMSGGAGDATCNKCEEAYKAGVPTDPDCINRTI